MIFRNPTFIAIGIPLIFLFTGALCKKIVRGRVWLASDFFLGVESTMAALSAALIYIYDLAKELEKNSTADINGRLLSTAGFSVLAFLLVLYAIATHQEWEHRSDRPGLRFVFLGMVCNSIGFGLMIIFVLFVKEA